MNRSNKVSRRGFLKRGAGVAAAAVAAPMIIPSSVLGRDGEVPASERILVGVIGVGNRAKMLMNQLPKGATIVAISDCYIKRMEDAKAAFEKKPPMYQEYKDWPGFQDYRQMLEKVKLDAVLVPTTDHGRPLPCIHAMQAGLDVYAEKPLATTIAEGQAMLKTARHYKRIFQVGSQQRTMEFNQYACNLVRSGGIGKIKEVKAQNYPGPHAIDPDLTEEPIPAGDDWSMWCQATELRPFNSKLQFGWMRWRPYSGGEMTNWGAHGVDQIQSALGMDGTGPVEFWPIGPVGLNGKVGMRYANGVTVSFEDTEAPMGGAIFYGEKGKVIIDRNGFKCEPMELAVNPPPEEKKTSWTGPGWNASPHMQNWLDCIKSRALPNADVEIGHRSISICHLLNITRELGRKLEWDPKNETFVNDSEANGYLSRPRRKGFELPVS